MSRAQKWFPKEYNPDNYEHVSYSDIVSKFGDIVASESFGDWQGEHIFILRKKKRKNSKPKIGYLVQSYGSCSGCDVLEACSSYKDLDGLINSMEQGIEWYKTKKELLARLDELKTKNPSYIYERDWDKVEKKLREVLVS